MTIPLPKYIKSFFQEYEHTDFIIGTDSFEDVELNDANKENGFWYFKNNKKTLIKRFILKRGAQTDKVCTVILIKKGDKFIPKFDFQIWNSSKSACEKYERGEIEENLIKAKVDINDCSEAFMSLIEFISQIDQIDFDAKKYSFINAETKDLYENLSKDEAIKGFVTQYGNDISDKDINLLLNRRSKLEYFGKLLHDKDFFDSEKTRLNKTDESLWQYFFEENQWVFGYGLQLISCEGLDDSKLETTVVGNDLLDGSGKRIDALLKTKGTISKFLFCEIKKHHSGLLISPNEYRPGVYTPSGELIGAVAQIQKTIHKVTLKLQENFIKPTETNGDPTGEEILFVRPRGLVLIGVLGDFNASHGINYEKLSSFELYRQQTNGIEIMTYDELYERVKFIVEENETL